MFAENPFAYDEMPSELKESSLEATRERNLHDTDDRKEEDTDSRIARIHRRLDKIEPRVIELERRRKIAQLASEYHSLLEERQRILANKHESGTAINQNKE